MEGFLNLPSQTKSGLDLGTKMQEYVVGGTLLSGFTEISLCFKTEENR